MKNKKLIIILIILIMIFLSLIVFFKFKMNNENNINNEEYFVIISNEKQGYIVYDKRTRVQYYISSYGYSCCPLVDYTGNPLLYKY